MRSLHQLFDANATGVEAGPSSAYGDTLPGGHLQHSLQIVEPVRCLLASFGTGNGIGDKQHPDLDSSPLLRALAKRIPL